jgi:hypothetical protein
LVVVSRAGANRAFKRCQLGPERIFDLPRVGCNPTAIARAEARAPGRTQQAVSVQAR